MATSLNATNITPPRVPLTDERTGLISREWYRFFANLFMLVGNGSNDISLLDVQYAPPQMPSQPTEQGAFDNSATDSPLLSQLAEIKKQLDGIESQGDGGVSELLAEVQTRFNALQSVVQPQLGTLSAVNQDYVQYLGFDTAPPWMGTKGGQFWYDSTTFALNIQQGPNVTQQIGEELFRYGKASASISDTNLQIVYKTGVVGASGVITFAPTVAGITDPDQILGVATEPITSGNFGRVTTYGVVHGINTTGSAYGEVWVDNDDIWYNPITGNPTKTKPSAPNIKIQIGTVINAGSGGSGSFVVKLGSTSALGGTDSNVQLGTLANKDLLEYDGVAGYWKNVPAATVIAGATGAPVTKTADFTVGAAETWLINNKSGSTCTVTLPAASTSTGRILYFQNYQAQTLVSASSNVVPIAGGSAGTAILADVAGDTCTLVSDGTNWITMQYVPNNVLLI